MKTTPPNIDEIFHQAVEIADPAKRATFLNAACGGDTALRQEIEALLRHDQEGASFLESPPAGILDIETAPPSISEFPGATIGRYKLLEQIGEGGMGVVFVAEQTEPVRRRVALKIIKPGMDTKQVIARFEAERQALAMMDHPNIARIFDAGTLPLQIADCGLQIGSEPNPQSAIRNPQSCGRPYFVMELVRGLPITDYCDKARFSPRQRLELFIDVCHAVQHAHQKGIIHRDLKPSNVMVTVHDGRPVAKVIDFGVAKAVGQQLTERTVYTAHAQLVGTPVYMSPEQADLSSQDVDTRSDVYSLGVLLYELLTGQPPFDKDTLHKAGFDEMRRIIREEEPETVSARLARTKSSRQTPSAVAASSLALPTSPNPRVSELDWIVMKALDKAPSRRYESASALAADIQRYLAGDQVLACPPTTMYRFQKFARKHKPALATASAIAACLLLGTTVSAWQAVRATTAEGQAEANEQKAVVAAAAAQEKEHEAIKQRDEVKALADKLAAKEEELQQTLYADHIFMAKAAWDSGNITRLNSLLNKHLPRPGEIDRRGFEWHYLHRLSQIRPLVSITSGVPNTIASGNLPIRLSNTALSVDRTRLIGFIPGGPSSPQRITSEPTLKVWNLQTGQEEFSAVLSGAGSASAFSPDGTRLVTGTGTSKSATLSRVAGNLQVWDTSTGKDLASHTGAIDDLVFSANSQLLASPCEDRTLKVIDLRTGQVRISLKGHGQQAHGLALSPDGNRLASTNDNWDESKGAYVAGEFKVWDVQTGEALWTSSGITTWVASLAFSPDGKRLASAAEGIYKLWDAQTGEHIKTFRLDAVDAQYAQSPSDVVFSPDGTRLIGIPVKKEQDRWVQYATMWNTQTGQDLLSVRECSLSFSPDGKRVAAENWEKSRTKLYDAQSGQQVLNVLGTSPTFSADGKRMAVSSDGLRIWDLESGDEINHIKGYDGERMLAFSLDGKRLISTRYSGAEVWDAESRQENSKELTFQGMNRQSGRIGPSPAVFSSDLTRLAAISSQRIKIFDGRSGQELRTLAGHENRVMCTAISADGKRVASSDGQSSFTAAAIPGVVKVWDADTGSELFTIKGHERSIVYLSFSPDGKKLAGSADDRTVTIWDAQSGRKFHMLGAKSTRLSPLSRLAFSSDSKRLAGGGKIWDAESGQELVILGSGADGVIDSVAFSPDGKYVVGGSLGTVSDAQTGKQLFNTGMRGSTNGHPWLAFSPDGKRLASSSGIWDARTGQQLLSFGKETISGQVMFSADGHRLSVVPFHGNTVTIYDATPLPEKR